MPARPQQPRSPIEAALRLGSDGLAMLGLLLGLAACGSEGEGPQAPVARSPELAQVRELDGGLYALDAEQPSVLLFVGRLCPISNATVPELRRIFEEYSSRGFDFRLVYTDRDDSLEELRVHRREYDLELPALLDFEQRLAQRFGVTVTPEVALVSPQGELLYRGRINDLYADFNLQRSEPQNHDLRRALEAVLAGETPNPERSQAVGCVLPDPAVGR